jgi:ABC-type polysaccharide transport system permease subunit
MNSISNEQTVENIIQTLIALPEFLRKSILEGRIKEFFSLGTQDKHEIVLGVLQSISSFEEKKISVLVKTWFEVLSNFDAAQIFEMLRLY